MKKLFLVFALLPCLLAISQTNPSSKTAEQLRQFIQGQHDYFGFNGSVLYALEGKMVYQHSVGYADYNSKRLLNDSSVFELASVSKQFTAMGIMICKEKKLLRLDDKVIKYIPSFPYPEITIRQLLTHTSGIPDYEEQFRKHWDHKKIAYNKDVVAILAKLKDSLRFEPGSKWEYSNTGYAMLAMVVENVSGLTFANFLSAHVFKPLGMRNTYIYNDRRTTEKLPDNYALGFIYSKSKNKYILPDEEPAFNFVYYLDGIVGDGTVNSTVGDLLIWTNSLKAGKLVSQSSLDEMLSPLVRMDPRDSTQFYGYGVMIQPDSPNGKIISHTGGWPGYTTYLMNRSKKNETLVILSNNEKFSANIRVTLESILNGEEVVLPYEHKEIKIDTSLLDKYAGQYKAFLTLEFIKKDGKLWRHRAGTPDIELKPESETKFFYADGSDRQIEFEVDSAGKVTKCWFINTGLKGEMKKI